MTKTKRQLRAEAVERLRELRAGTFNYMDLAASVAGIDGYACADTFALALIDLLTDEEPPEGDVVAILRKAARSTSVNTSIGDVLRYNVPGNEPSTWQTAEDACEALADMIERDYVRRDKLPSYTMDVAHVEELQLERDEWKAKTEHYRKHVDRLMEAITRLAQKQPMTFDPEAPYESAELVGKYIDELEARAEGSSNLEWLFEHCADFRSTVCSNVVIYDHWYSGATGGMCFEDSTQAEEWLLSPHSKSHSHSEPLSDSERGQRERESAMDENGTGNGTCPDAIGQSSNHSKAQSKDAPTLSGLYGVLSDDCGQNADMSQKDGDCVREGWETSNSGTAEAETSQLPESDTREKLEADVRDYWYHTRGGWETAKVYEWLDRQAAITQAEFAGEIEIWKSGFRDMSKKLEASTQACDDYRSEWHRVCADRADLQRELTTEKNKGVELAEQLGKAMAERDEYRAKVGAMLDAAQEIRRLGDIE